MSDEVLTMPNGRMVGRLFVRGRLRTFWIERKGRGWAARWNRRVRVEAPKRGDLFPRMRRYLATTRR